MGCDVYRIDYDSIVRNTLADDMTINDRLKIAYNFDFNKGLEEDGLTFEYKFMLNHCNILGERYKPHSAHVVITEFRKFMALVANTIAMNKNDNGNA